MTALPDPIETFIARWQGVAASELATAQSFVIDLCALLDVPRNEAYRMAMRIKEDSDD